MRVVDTSAWIERVSDSPTGKRVKPEWPPREQLLVPTLVQLEIAKWLRRETSEETMDQVLAYTERCVVAQLDTRTALRAAEICREHKLSTADAIIYATALEHGAELLTCEIAAGPAPDVSGEMHQENPHNPCESLPP
jgi:predicted nucleic acid-binding protein